MIAEHADYVLKNTQSYVNADIITNPSFPRCGELEDASHVSKCFQPQAQAV